RGAARFHARLHRRCKLRPGPRRFRGTGSSAGRGGIIIPAGGLPMLLFARERPFIIHGALVLNRLAVVAQARAMALALRPPTGPGVRRRGSYGKASAACVEEYLARRW